MLEQKEPKIQDKPDPSGRFVGHHTVTKILQTALQIRNDIELYLLDKFKMVKVTTQVRWAERVRG